MNKLSNTIIYIIPDFFLELGTFFDRKKVLIFMFVSGFRLVDGYGKRTAEMQGGRRRKDGAGCANTTDFKAEGPDYAGSGR